jgi:Tol biopolymer transport system component
VNSSATDYFPVISMDGLSLYFSSSRSGGQGSYDTWVATRSSTTDAFSAPVNLPVNTSAGEEAIAISSDELTYFIQSEAGGGQGGQDVWWSTRASKGEAFPQVSNLTEVNSSASDQATWLSPDGERLYQSSTRDGSWSIYVSSRSCLD